MKLLFLLQVLLLLATPLAAQSDFQYTIKSDSLVDEKLGVTVVYETLDVAYRGPRELTRRLINALQTSGLTYSKADSIFNAFVSYKKELFEDGIGFAGNAFYHERTLTDLGTHHNLYQFGVSTYAYAGGAHPNGHGDYACFSTLSGRRLGWKDIVKPGAHKPLTAYAEKVFRDDQKLEPHEPLTAKGHYFYALETAQYPFGAVENNAFRLSDGFYFTTDALVLPYNRYEISPYVMLPPTLELPLREVDQYLNLPKQ